MGLKSGVRFVWMGLLNHVCLVRFAALGLVGGGETCKVGFLKGDLLFWV